MKIQWRFYTLLYKARINEPWLSRNGAHLTGSIVQWFCSTHWEFTLCTSQRSVLLIRACDEGLRTCAPSENARLAEDTTTTPSDGAHLAETLLWEARNHRTMTFQKRCTPYWFDRSMALFLHSESLLVIQNSCNLKSDENPVAVLHPTVQG